MIITGAHQLQATGLGVRCNLFDAHLCAAATNLTNPAHHRNTPALARDILDADHLTRLKLGGYFARPCQAIASRAVVDHRQDISRKMPIAVGRVIAVIILQLRVFDFFVGQQVLGVALRRHVEGVAPLVLALGGRRQRRKFRLPAAVVFQQLTERALATQIEMQGAHADAQGQLALACRALKTALGGLPPGGTQVLQGIQAQTRRHQQRLGRVGLVQMSVDGRHQRGGINGQQIALLFAPEFGAVARRGIEHWRDGEQPFHRLARIQAYQRAP